MAKLTLTDASSGYDLATAYNANNTLIEAALENTLSRDGTSPNSMGADLDMNSNQIINLADPTLDTDAVNKQYLDTVIAGIEGLSDLSSLNAGTPGSTDVFVFEDISENVNKKLTLTALATAVEALIDHDALTNFVANEHINHSSVTLTAGTGLSGGGDITANRSFALSHLGIESLADPNADRILFWDDSAGNTAWLSLTNGLEFSGTTLNAKLASTRGLAFESGAIAIDLTALTEDNVPSGTDVFVFDDGTPKKITWTNLISVLETGLSHDNLSGFVANEHVNHGSVSITAGTGMTGGGTIASSRTLNVIGGTGITANADDIELDISGLTALSGASVAATDGYLVDDAGTMKRIAHQSAGIPYTLDSTTSRTLVDADANTFIEMSNASAITVTLNTGVGETGNIILIKQGAAGQVTVSGTATIDNANGTKTAAQESVICLYCTAANTWTLFGDATT